MTAQSECGALVWPTFPLCSHWRAWSFCGPFGGPISCGSGLDAVRNRADGCVGKTASDPASGKSGVCEGMAMGTISYALKCELQPVGWLMFIGTEGRPIAMISDMTAPSRGLSGNHLGTADAVGGRSHHERPARIASWNTATPGSILSERGSARNIRIGCRMLCCRTRRASGGRTAGSGGCRSVRSRGRGPGGGGRAMPRSP